MKILWLCLVLALCDMLTAAPATSEQTCQVGQTTRRYGEIWKSKDENTGVISDCTCRKKIHRPHDPPLAVCNEKGCFTPFNGIQDEGSKMNNCTCTRKFRHHVTHRGIHLHWRCDHESKYCQSEDGSVLVSVGTNWIKNTARGTLKLNCSCYNMPAYKYPKYECFPVGGCHSSLPAQKRYPPVFQPGEIVAGKMCVYNTNPVKSYAGKYFHWVQGTRKTIQTPNVPAVG